MNGDHPPDCPAYYTPMDVPLFHPVYCTCSAQTHPAHGGQMTITAKHTPPTTGYTIEMANAEGYWLCSATSDKDGIWKLDLPEQIYGAAPMAITQIVSDDPEHVEATLTLIAEAIDARLFPKGDPKIREDIDRIIKVTRAVCSTHQLDIIYQALGQDELDMTKLDIADVDKPSKPD